MGPSCAVADVQGKEVTVWSSTQGVYPLRQAVARMLALPNQNVHVIYMEGSGCYGLNGADTVSLDAAIMSNHVGKPVRVQWMRGDEHVWEHYGTPMVMKLKGGLDATGNLTAWDYEGWQAARGGRPGNVGAANLPTGYLIGLRLPARNITAPRLPPLGADNSNTEAGYLLDEEGLLENARVISHTVDSPFFTGPLRSPARIQNTFANESFIDELAAAAKVDPVEFRLRYIGDERLAHALRVAAKAAGWQARPSPKQTSQGNIATGRGISVMQYEGEDGYAATVVELEVNKKTGKVRVTRVVVSHDVGIIINPNGLKAQIEGNVVHGVSRSLKEEVQLNRRISTSKDWESYQVLRFTELPEVKIALINRVNEAPDGLRRERDDRHSGGRRECDLRRDRGSPPPLAFHACPREGGTALAVDPEGRSLGTTAPPCWLRTEIRALRRPLQRGRAQARRTSGPASVREAWARREAGRASRR